MHLTPESNLQSTSKTPHAERFQVNLVMSCAIATTLSPFRKFDWNCRVTIRSSLFVLNFIYKNEIHLVDLILTILRICIPHSLQIDQ